MAKRFFTQSASVLLSKATSLDAIVPLLSEFVIAKRIDNSADPELSGPSLVLAFRPDVNGYVSVDIRNKKWPDHMGDPETDPMLLGAWSMGYYGPFTFPGGLKRAREHLWTWPEGKEIAGRHEAFIHISTSYIFGAEKELQLLPPDYDSLAELNFVTRIALALLKHPDALMYFNSNGEVLGDEKLLRKSLDYHGQHQLPPFDIWANIRMFRFDREWGLMDTVGMEQLDCPDLEMCFPAEKYKGAGLAYFLRNCSLYLLNKGEVVKDKDTMDGPGNIRWQAHHVKEGIVVPPRRVIRWFPMDGSKPPEALRV